MRTIYLNANSPNVIYLITCCKRSRKYIGKTLQKLDEILNLHMNGFKHSSTHEHCKIFDDYFTKGIWKATKQYVQINEETEKKLEEKRGAMDPSFAEKKKAKEIE